MAPPSRDAHWPPWPHKQVPGATNDERLNRSGVGVSARGQVYSVLGHARGQVSNVTARGHAARSHAARGQVSNIYSCWLRSQGLSACVPGAPDRLCGVEDADALMPAHRQQASISRDNDLGAAGEVTSSMSPVAAASINLYGVPPHTSAETTMFVSRTNLTTAWVAASFGPAPHGHAARCAQP